MSERLYRLLLRFYPSAFRERYADEMLRLLRDRLRDEPALYVWTDTLVDALVSIPKQHLTVVRSHLPYPRSAAPFYAKLYGRCVLSAVSLGVMVSAGIVAAFFIRGGWMITVMTAVVSIAAMWRGQRQTKRIMKSYRAESDDDSVTVSCAPLGMTPLTLSRSEVTALHRVTPFGLRIHAADPASDLWVPEGTPDYDAVQARVSQWAPLKESSLGMALINAAPAWYPMLLSLLCIVTPATSSLWTAHYIMAGFCVVGALGQRSMSRIVLALAPAAIVLARRFL